MPIKNKRKTFESAKKRVAKKLRIACTFLLALLMALAPITPVHAAGNPYYGGWSNCTWGAWQALYNATGIALPGMGNASDWLWRAQSYGYATGTAPAAGSIAVYTNHVAYVSAVSSDQSSVYIIEGGFNGGYNERWVSSWAIYGQSLQGYIYTGVTPSVSQVPAPAEPVYTPPVQEVYTAPVYTAPAVTQVSQPDPIPEPEPEPEPVEEFDETKPNTDLLPGILIYTDDITEDVLTEGRESISFSGIKELTTAASDKSSEATSLKSINSNLNATKINFGEVSLLQVAKETSTQIRNDKMPNEK